MDKIASLCIYGKIETIVENVMRKLSLDIPRWKIIRRIKFIYENHSLKIKSLDLDGKPFSICKKVVILDKKQTTLTDEPFIYKEKNELSKIFDVILHFHAYYKEPELKISLEKDKLKNMIYILEYDPYKCIWDDVYAVEDKI